MCHEDDIILVFCYNYFIIINIYVILSLILCPSFMPYGFLGTWFLLKNFLLCKIFLTTKSKCSHKTFFFNKNNYTFNNLISRFYLFFLF
jgi:hypothetical protein